MENNNTGEVAEIVGNALRDFNEGISHGEQLSIRIGRRTTQIIRFGMLSMMMLGLALFYLIFILTRDFSAISLQVLNKQFTDMNRSIDSMAGNMHQMAKPMKAFPFP